MNFITSIFEAIANFFGFAKDKQTLENTPQMVANAQAKQLAKDKADAVADINADNLDNLRKDVSE